METGNKKFSNKLPEERNGKHHLYTFCAMNEYGKIELGPNG